MKNDSKQCLVKNGATKYNKLVRGNAVIITISIQIYILNDYRKKVIKRVFDIKKTW